MTSQVDGASSKAPVAAPMPATCDCTCDRDMHLFCGGPKRILSLDGGGVRGAISVAFLERIEEIFSQHQRQVASEVLKAKEIAGAGTEQLADIRRQLETHTIRLSDRFDLVGGTSTGAVI